jgi:PAS domain S-box-containing protein
MDTIKLKNAYRLVRELTNSEPTTPLNQDELLDALLKEIDVLKKQRTEELDQANKILTHLLDICGGDYSAQLKIEDKDTPLNAIACAINVYSEELLHSTVSEEEHLSSLNSLPYIVWSSNIAFTEIYFVNNKVKEIFGLDPNQMLETPNLWVDVIHPEDKAFVEQAFDAFLVSGEFNIEYRVIHQESKEILWINDIANFLLKEDGTRYRIVGTCKDITDEKHFELENKINQTRLEEAQRISKIGNWELDFTTNNLFWSKEHFDIFEIPYDTPNEVLYSEYRSKIIPEDLERLDPLVENTIQTGQPFEFIHRIQLPNKPIKYIRGLGNVTIGLKGEILGIKGTAQDITNEMMQQNLVNDTLTKLNSILNSADYSIISTDNNGIVTLFNQGAEKMLGYKANEFIGKQTPAILHDEEEIRLHGEKLKKEIGAELSDEIDTFHFKTRTTGLPDVNEWTYIHKDGRRIPIELILTAVRDEANEVVGYLGIAKDITEDKRKSKELIAAKEEIEKFFNLSQDFMGIANTNGFWGSVNQTFVKELGYTSDEILRTPFLELIHPDDIACTGLEVEKLAQGVLTIDFENRYRRKDGSYVWISWRAAPDVSTGNLYCTGRNVTEVKARENERLYTIQLEKDKEVAEQKTKVKERFLANMSHEIRTPMNSILGLSNLMEKVGTLNPKQMDYMKTIKLNSKNLLNIINDILDLSKIEEGKLEIEKVNFDIKELVHNVRKSLDLVAHKKKIKLNSHVDEEIPALLLGDSTRLNQVLLNLTNNAIKFTHEGSVQLNLKLLRKEENQVRLRFEIKDTGIGIESDKISSIFDAFSQEKSSTTRLYGGTGLGLSISNQIIQALHSEIHVESEPNVGSTFYFELTFPLSKVDASKNNFELPTQAMELVGKYHLLLVEDNPFNQMVAEDTLKDWHGELEIDIAENGIIALEKLQQTSYDLVLMDIQMPEMDGHEATKKARTEYGIRVPILAMTAQATPAEIEACIQSGMNDYISKPFKEEDLFSKITYWLQTDFLK